MTWWVRPSAGLVAVALACQPAGGPSPSLSDGMSVSCPVTRPDPSTTPPPGVDPIAPGGGLYGNDALWVGLPDNGVLTLEAAPGGVLGRKFMWWRRVPGQLSIEVRSLDQPGLIGESSIPDGYGEYGFQATGLSFPKAGC